MAKDKDIINDLSGQLDAVGEENRQLEERINELNAENQQLIDKLNAVGEIDPVAVVAENETLKKKVKDLNSKLAATAGAAPVNVKGFLLAHNDPFGLGAVRVYRSCGGKSSQHDGLPFVLPDKDAATKAATGSYIVRADGAGDKERVAAARKKLAAIG